MNIKFNEDGKILACGIPSQIPDSTNVVSVVDKDLPKDFLRTFALGKYRVDPQKKKLVENKQFKMPERPSITEKLPKPLAVKKQKTALDKTTKLENSSGTSGRKKRSK